MVPRYVAVLLLAALAWAAPAAADDRHAGYYYPHPQTVETYAARAQTAPEADRELRIGFVVGLTQQLLDQPYPPDFAIFPKGEEAEKLLIVALRDGVIDSLYRARALLAMLTAVARGGPFFQERGVEDLFTFFDLAKLLGFTQITISDGDRFAHQVLLE